MQSLWREVTHKAADFVENFLVRELALISGLVALPQDAGLLATALLHHSQHRVETALRSRVHAVS